MFLCHPRQRIRCCKLLRKFSALWKMSDRGDEAVNAFSNWLTIPCKMSHTRRPVLKRSQNTWKSGANTNTASFCNSHFFAFVFCHIVIFGHKVKNSPSLHELCSIINRHIMRISCICVIAASARILAAAPWENAATLSCCLPYQIHTMDSKPASTCFSIFYKYKDKYKHKDKFKYTNQNNGQLCSYYVFF